MNSPSSLSFQQVRSLKIETVAVHGGDQHDPGGDGL